MDDTVKLTSLIVGGFLLAIGILAATCQNMNEVDAKAPVVETCIKHPVTRSPLTGRQ